MPTIGRFNGIKIMIYAGDHNPPHFYAEYAEFKATFGINPVSLVAGEFPLKQAREVIAWASEHQTELMEHWQRLNNG